jgi:hypothetical protein
MSLLQGSSSSSSESSTEINAHTMDKDYDLVSVLYHALQAADTCSQYERDARAEGSPQVAEFMREVQQQNERIARRAKELLVTQKQV